MYEQKKKRQNMTQHENCRYCTPSCGCLITEPLLVVIMDLMLTVSNSVGERLAV